MKRIREQKEKQFSWNSKEEAQLKSIFKILTGREGELYEQVRRNFLLHLFDIFKYKGFFFRMTTGRGLGFKVQIQ